MSPGLPSTLSRILKPLACASLITPASAVAPGDQRNCRFTQAIPAYRIRSGREKSDTCPPSSNPPGAPPPPPEGGGTGLEGGGGGAEGSRLKGAAEVGRRPPAKVAVMLT